MKEYCINEIFYSLQGEGRWAGTPAIFIRFSGCNLHCSFCDTNFTQSQNLTIDAILTQVKEYGDACRFIVFTGGEPSLQLDEALIERLHREGYYIAVETNGTRRLPANIDWITCSPKAAFVNNGTPVLSRASEVKVVFDSIHQIDDYGIIADEYYIQPCDTGNIEQNKEIILKAIAFVKANPQWKLSLQQQKILSIR